MQVFLETHRPKALSMPEFTYDPAITPTTGFLQTIRMNEGGQPIGTAVWHAAVDSKDGIVQILEFNIAPQLRRHGSGKRLMAALVGQVLAYHRARKMPLRRLWAALRHKSQIIARAFFASEGFTHIATVKDLLANEEALIYIRTFD